MFIFPELENTLVTAVADGGRTARDRVEAEARASDELEITFHCYAALSAWGRDGLDLIVEIASAGHTVKSKSGALTLLTTLAAQGAVPTTGLYFVSSQLAALINGKIDPVTIRSASRKALRLLILSLPVDDLLIPVSQSFMHLRIAQAELAEELVTSLSVKWLRLGPLALDAYEKLLTDSAHDEVAFQSFFIEYPQLLDPMAVQVWSQPDFHGALEPDFVIRRADDTFVVVEIECPGKQLMTASNRLSQQAAHAENQALEYEDFLSSRIAEAQLHFPSYRRADCLAVIGLERSLTSPQRQGLVRANARRQNSKVVGFDWLLDRARTVVGNVSESRIEVIKRHRVI